MALSTNGTLYAWGASCLGRLGFSSKASNRPLALGAGWKAISVRDSHVLALSLTGDLWTWGVDYRNPPTGDGSDAAEAAPEMLGTGFVSMAAGNRSNVAVKADGSLWTWGVNYFGEAGDGRQTFRAMLSADLDAAQ